jgi:hypothetical protein
LAHKADLKKSPAAALSDAVLNDTGFFGHAGARVAAPVTAAMALTLR